MRKLQLRSRVGLIGLSFAVFQITALGAETAGLLRAGAAAMDITPREFPVRVSGSFLERTTSEIKDRLHARCVVLDDGRSRIAIVVIDNCVIPRDVLDRAKQLAARATGIPEDRMLMSATHTHSGPALDAILGCDGNPQYREWLPQPIAQAVQTAAAQLVPARIGWTVVNAAEYTHCREWIRRPDRIDIDPFGNRTVRAMMHPGYQNPDYLGPAGPSDPDLSIVSVQSLERRPIALLANYSMHYFGAEPLSADYFGAFADKAAELLGGGGLAPCVAMMSNGTSGDQHWMDYSQPKPQRTGTHLEYAEVLARRTAEACKHIEYHDAVPIGMREKRLSLMIRPISDQDLQKARELAATFEGGKPKTLPEVYAAQQVQLSQMPAVRELKLQALSIGELGIAAIPCEVFAVTGLKIKAFSPLKTTFTIELANGYDGYLPPPARHPLGGYTTWRARSACLEVEAEPKIVAATLELMEEASGRPRRVPTGEDYPLGDYPQAVLASRPLAYWRFNEFEGPRAADESGNGRHGRFEPNVVFHLEGPSAASALLDRQANRAAHFAGGRMSAAIEDLADSYAVEMWFSNYLPAEVRAVTGCLFSRDPGPGGGATGDYLAIGGGEAGPGRLVFSNGDAGAEPLVGHSETGTKTWNHLVMVRNGSHVRIYLNGNPAPDVAGAAGSGPPSSSPNILIGGHGLAGFEGRIDEVAVYGRPLSADEVADHYKAAKREAPAAR